MKAVRYFVAGGPKSYEVAMGIEECFFVVVDNWMPNILQKSPEECKFDHLARARIFRVTVEEVPKELLEKRSVQM